MLKIRDTYINLKNVLLVETYILESNGLYESDDKFIIDFIFGENYCYNETPYTDNRGYNRVHESSSNNRIHKKFIFTDKKEFDEVLSVLEGLDENIIKQI